MIKIYSLLISCLLTLLLGASPSIAEKRVALVIGNAKYTQMQSLPNPAKDAQLMAETLGKLGFDVISASDTDFLGMRRAVKKFGKKLRASGKDAVGLFYYAGHGVQSRGENYLIPLGAEVEDEADLDIETIATSVVLSQMEAAGNSLNMIILDACRNNPFKGSMRSASRGLARVNAASGSIVAFAAAPGQTASDGNGDNSPYTQALVKAMQVPGLSVEQMFKRVRISVETETGNKQTPWEESSLRGDFYFTQKKPDPVVVLAPKVDQAEKEWLAIQHTQSSGVLKSFINRHPKSIFANYSQTILNEKATTSENPNVMELAYWNSIQSSKDAAVFQDYISRYPKGNFVFIATSKMAELKNAQKQQKLASLQSRSASALEPTSATDPYELTVLLQTELNRVGCNAGTIDGQWGKNGRRALAQFKRYAKLTFSFEDISPETIEAVKQERSRVCPKPRPVRIKSTVAKAKPKTKVKSGGYINNVSKSGGIFKTWAACMSNSGGRNTCNYIPAQ